MANRIPMDFSGELFPVDIALPASIVVRIEKRCWCCDSLSKRCSSFVIEQVGSTATEAIHVSDLANEIVLRNARKRNPFKQQRTV